MTNNNKDLLEWLLHGVASYNIKETETKKSFDTIVTLCRQGKENLILREIFRTALSVSSEDKNDCYARMVKNVFAGGVELMIARLPNMPIPTKERVIHGIGTITRYRPAYVSGLDEESVEFSSMKGLFNIKWVGSFRRGEKSDAFSHFEIDRYANDENADYGRYMLWAVYQKSRWGVGYINDNKILEKITTPFIKK